MFLMCYNLCMFKIIRKILFLLVILGFLLVSIIVAIGYIDYKSEVDVISVEEKVKEIESIPNYTKIADISSKMKDAIIAIEDRRFYEHNGVDYYALVRGFVVTISNQGVQGGSTLSQQLAKNMYFMKDNSGIKKISEAFVAKEIEDTYEKEKILELYLNMAYYGDGYYGIYDASMGYFQKTPAQLTLSEASVLAGLPQAPSIYALSNENEQTKERQIRVLKSMLELDMINQREYDEASQFVFF